MNVINRYIKAAALLFLMVFSVTTYAQNRIDPTLEVKRDFDAKLAEIIKGKLNTSLPDSLSRFDLDFNYSVLDKPVRDLYDFSPLPSANLEKQGAARLPQFYARTGANLLPNPFASVKYQPNISQSVSLLLYGDYNSFFGKLPLFYIDYINPTDNHLLIKSDNKVISPYTWYRAGANFKYDWKKGVVGVDLSYNDNYLGLTGFESSMTRSVDYYGRNLDNMTQSWVKTSLSRRNGVANVKVYVSSHNPDNNTFHYSAAVSFSSLNDKTKIEKQALDMYEIDEKNIDIDASIGYGFADHSNFSIGAKYENSKFSYTDDRSRNSIELYPHYTFQHKGWLFDLGVKLVQWNNIYTDQNRSNFFLSGLASFELVKNKLWFYALLDGESQMYTYQKLLAINPLVIPVEPSDLATEQPIIIKSGFRGNIAERISYHIYGGYEKYRNQIFFIKTESLNPFNGLVNGFRPFFDDETRFLFGGELFFKSKAVDAQIGLKTTSFETNDMNDIHYNYSPLEISGRLRYNWRERIVIAADFGYRHKTPTIFMSDEPYSPYFPPGGFIIYETKAYIPSYAIVNIEATYAFTQNFSFFVRGNNLLNTPFSPIPFYASQGLGLGVGINVKF